MTKQIPKPQRTRQRIRQRTRQRRGYAMLLVMVIIMTSSAFVALHQRNLNAALRIEQARIRSEDHRNGPITVLAIACERLEPTNAGPPAPISYSYLHIDGPIGVLYQIDYAVSGTQWTVTAEPSSSAFALPALPDSF